MSFQVVGPSANQVHADQVTIQDPYCGMGEEFFMDLASKILVVIPHRPSEGINPSLYRNQGFWARAGTPSATVQDQFAGFIELTRVGMVRAFNSYVKDRPEVEYCVMIDNDEEVGWDAPYRLASWGKDIVSGIVCSFSRRRGGVFACVTVKDKQGVARFPTVDRTRNIPAQGIKEIESCGAGLVCIHRRVFEAILDDGDYPFMIPEDVRRKCAETGTLLLGEDMAFSKQASKLGFKLWVDFAVRAGHLKTTSISWPEEMVDPTLDVREWEVSDKDYIHR